MKYHLPKTSLLKVKHTHTPDGIQLERAPGHKVFDTPRSSHDNIHPPPECTFLQRRFESVASTHLRSLAVYQKTPVIPCLPQPAHFW